MYSRVYSAVEGFEGSGSGILGLLAVALIVVVQLFVIRWLWNTVLVRVLSVARPIPSLLYTLGLLILMAMLNPVTVVSSA